MARRSWWERLSPKQRDRVKLGAFLTLGVGGMVGLFWLGSNGYLATSADDEERPLNYLALKLESAFRRDVHQNPYSIDYSAKPPNTIVIAVGYYALTDRADLNGVVRAAGENARGVARDQFHIPNLSIETEWTQLPGKPLKPPPPDAEPPSSDDDTQQQ